MWQKGKIGNAYFGISWNMSTLKVNITDFVHQQVIVYFGIISKDYEKIISFWLSVGAAQFLFCLCSGVGNDVFGFCLVYII